MNITRVYTAPDGESRAEDVELADGNDVVGVAMLMDKIASRAMMVRFSPNYQQEWHYISSGCSIISGTCVVALSAKTGRSTRT